MTMDREQRSQRRTDRTRGDIRHGAATAFGRYGYSQTSVQRIIEEAAVTRRTFYRYYRSKEDIFNELLDALVDSFCEHIDDAPDEPSIRERLRARITGLLDVAYANRALLRAVTEAIHVNPAHAERWARMRRVIEARNRAAIRWCIGQGVIAPLDATVIARLLSVTSETAVLDLATDEGIDRTTVAHAVADMYWNTLFRPYEGADDYILESDARPKPVFERDTLQITSGSRRPAKTRARA